MKMVDQYPGFVFREVVMQQAPPFLKHISWSVTRIWCAPADYGNSTRDCRQQSKERFMAKIGVICEVLFRKYNAQ